MVVDNSGKLFIVDGGNHRVVYINNANTASSGVAFSGFIGQNNFTTGTVNSGAGAASKHSFNFSVTTPSGLFSCTSTTFAGYLAITSSGQLFVSDPGNNRIMRFDSASYVNATMVFGQNNFPSTSSGSTISTLKTPMGITLSGNSLYVADMNNNRVLRYDNATTIGSNKPDANAVYGQNSFTSSTGGRSSTLFDIPFNVAVDGLGTLYINDSNNGRTVYINSASTKDGGSGSSVVFNGVIGQANLTTYAGVANQSTMWAGVTGMAVNSKTGKLIIGNTGFGRILQFNSSSPLPVDFLNIQAFASGSKIQVSWETENEVNVKHYEIEHSTDGYNFEKIGVQYPFENNTITRKKYSYLCNNLFQSNIHYFKIKEIDIDGKFKYSRVQIYQETLSKSLKIYPSNVENNINYEIIGAEKEVELRIISTTGDIIEQKTLSQMDGSIDVGYLKSGLYFVKICFEDQILTSKFIKL